MEIKKQQIDWDMEKWYFTYCKFADEKRFRAYDINTGYPVGNLIYCTLLENTEEMRGKLQRLADLNREEGLIVQLRNRNGRVVFQTK